MLSMFAYVFVSITIAIVMWFLMYLDSRLFDNHKSKLTYCKTIFVTFLLSCLSIYLHFLIGDAGVGESLTGGTRYLTDISQEILTGGPDF